MSYHRIVVKIGTSSLTTKSGKLNRAFVADLCAQLAALHHRGLDVLLVTSGAIGVGLDCLKNAGAPITQDGTARSLTLPHKQAAAAVGQGILMAAYSDAFSWRDVSAAQVLLTREDLADRSRFLNARNTLNQLLELRIIPIINENDTVAVEEIKFGDNDRLAALTAVLVEADLLIILSDVDGLYKRMPDENTPHEVIPVVRRIDESIENLAGGAGSRLGTGGMKTKIEAARIACSSGITTVIANSGRDRVLENILESKDMGTLFLPRKNALRGRKRWIAAGSKIHGSLKLNTGAVRRLLEDGASLLAVGIINVEGSFKSGDLVEVQDADGHPFARGLSNYDSDELRMILGKHSDEFSQILGHKSYEEIIHRDNLVIIR